MPESFRELNRLRRQQNAFEHLREYAAARGIPEPEAAAREAAEALHPIGGQQRQSERSKPTTRRATAPPTPSSEPTAQAQPAPAAEPVAAPPPAPAPEPAAAIPASPGDSPAPPSAPAPTAGAEEPEPEESPPVPHRLEDRTKDQLYARAQELAIEGRSQMTKEQLIEAIRAAQ